MDERKLLLETLWEIKDDVDFENETALIDDGLIDSLALTQIIAALDDALYLSGICRKVYLIHRRSEFRGMAAAVEKLREKAFEEFVAEENKKEQKEVDELVSYRYGTGTVGL